MKTMLKIAGGIIIAAAMLGLAACGGSQRACAEGNTKSDGSVCHNGSYVSHADLVKRQQAESAQRAAKRRQVHAVATSRRALSPAELRSIGAQGFLPADQEVFAKKYCGGTLDASCQCALAQIGGNDDTRLVHVLLAMRLGDGPTEDQVGGAVGRCIASTSIP